MTQEALFVRPTKVRDRWDANADAVLFHGDCRKEMSTGTSYGEMLIFDISRLRRHFPAVPVKVILVDVEQKPAHVIVLQEGRQQSLASQQDR